MAIIDHDDLVSLKDDFDDICEFIKNIGKYPVNLVTKLVFGNSVHHISLEEKTKDFTAIFPNIVDRTINMSSIEIINRVIEIKNSNLIRLILTSMTKENANKSVKDILRKLHRNIDDVDLLDFQLTEAAGIETKNLISAYRIEDYENCVRFNPIPLSECVGGDFLESLYEQTGIDLYDVYEEAKNDSGNKTYHSKNFNRNTNYNFNNNNSSKNYDNKNFNNNSKTYNDNSKNNMFNVKINNIEKKDDKEPKRKFPDSESDLYKLSGKKLDGGAASFASDKDIRFMNSLSPTMVEISLPTIYKGQTTIMTILLGVKSKIYPASQEELLDIINLNKKSKLFKFIQMSTGEIKFFKDFIFNIDYVKDRVGSNTNKSNESQVKKMWNVLQKRSRNKKSFKFNSMDNASIATLTLSTKTVEEIYRVKNIDLLDPNVAHNFVMTNSIMNLVIVDEVLEIVYIMSDNNDKSFLEMTFSYLDKELGELNGKPIKKSIGYFG